MEFTHFDKNGNAIMVDVSEKNITERKAVASGQIQMSRECYDRVKEGKIEKGDVLCVARIAGIMGTKRTSDLIPLCHSLSLSNVEIEFELKDNECVIVTFCKVKTTGKTGVEMEALTGVQVTLLTIYDMCKAIDKNMEMSEIHLCKKTGGKSGTFVFKGKES